MSEPKTFPENWLSIGKDYDPAEHMMQFSRFDKKTQKYVQTDYLNVQNRLLWFIRDQRLLIAAGLATCAYIAQTELVELDRERGFAHFKSHVRDVMGNEATMYGSETINDFPDFIEKASTKSLGRALALMGYGTNMAPDLDEGERVVDAPVERHEAQQTQTATRTNAAPTPIRQAAPQATGKPATAAQVNGIRNLSKGLQRPEPENLDTMGFEEASKMMDELSKAMDAKKSPAPTELATSEESAAKIVFRLMQTEKIDSLVLDMYCARPIHQIVRSTEAGLMRLATAMQSPNELAEMKILRWITNSKHPFTINTVDTLMRREKIKDYAEFAEKLAASRDDITNALKDMASH